MFGRLTLDAIRHGPIEASVSIGMLVMSVLITALLFYYQGWVHLWRGWIVTVNPKKIGIMYLVVALLMLFKGVVDASMLRTQMAMAAGEAHGFLHSSHFQQIFTVHGTSMIFFVAMGTVFGMLNLIVPMQIGARDVAFPFMNSLSFWLFSVGAILVNLSLSVGEFSGAGWLAYPPLSNLEYNPGVGIDYWIWSLQISGLGSLLSGINFIVTILKMRCPGMTLMKMPLFTWSALNSMILVVFAFPILTVTLGLLALDRTIGTHFFTTDAGGNPMLYVNLIWAWGHPEVYILNLPAFGVFSEVVATFSGKRLFGYVSMVWALAAITVLSFIVWLHHFFTMGAGPNVNAFFGIMTMLIAIPTGVKVFNWLFTMYKGRVRFTTPMLWFFGFVFTFTLGGMTGVLLSLPGFDFQAHNSLFLIAHFHSMVIGGVLFGFFCAYSYWFPKVFGFMLNERLGRYAFGFWFAGFIFAFMPLYVLGLMGATRRLDHYDVMSWQPIYILAAFGVALIIIGVIIQNIQLLYSIYYRRKNQDLTGDPWNGRTLEWATSSPPPFYNFAITPEVHERDPFWTMKEKGLVKPSTADIQPIHMPRRTAMGFFIGMSTFIMSFGIIWHIWWMAALGLFLAILFAILRLTDDHTEHYVPVEKIRVVESRSESRRRYS